MVRTAAKGIHELRGVGSLLDRALRLPHVEHPTLTKEPGNKIEQQESIQTRAIGLGGYGVGSLFLDHRCCSGKHGQQIACRLHLRTELGWSETARRNAEPEPEPEQQPEPEPEPEPEHRRSRSRSRSKVCGAYRRGRGLCPGVFRLPPGVIRQPRARPNRTLRPSPNQRPIVLLTPTATKPSAQSCKFHQT